MLSLLSLTPLPNSKGSVFTPRSLSGLSLWLDSADVLNGSNPAHNSKFSSWTDKSGSGNNFTQSTSGNQFTYGAAQLNSIDVVVGNRAANTYMSNAMQYFNTATPFTVFLTLVITNSLNNFVANFNNGTSGSSVLEVIPGSALGLIQQGSWLGSSWDGSAIPTSTAFMITMGYNGSGPGTAGNYFARLNGSNLTRLSDNGGAGTPTTAIGSDIVDGSLALGGYVLDFVIQAATATTTEESEMLAYEQTKWGF